MMAGHPSRVSVLIPTLNGGATFAASLQALEGQRGVEVLETLVADSGSTDQTVPLALKAGAHVVDTGSGEFNHGRVRNQLAERARGEVLLFMVQDAVLVGRDALHNALTILGKDPRLAAVSARQVPRSGADLHSRFQVWSNAMTLASLGMMEDQSGRDPANRSEGFPDPVLGRLSGAIVDNVCAAVRRSVWEELPFRELDFAEDLDFGLRAAARGWRTTFASNSVVAHHHDRDAAYWLSRTAVAGQCLSELLGDPSQIPAAVDSLGALGAGVRAVLRDLEAALATALGTRSPLRADHAVQTVAEALRVGRGHAEPSAELALVDELFEDHQRDHVAPDSDQTAEVLEVLESELLRRFLAASPEWMEPKVTRVFVARLAATRLGWGLGESMRRSPQAPLAARIRQRLAQS